MATYITLVNFTQKGIEKIKESPNRFDAAKKAFQSMGAEIKDFFLVMGRYDIVLISNAPNDCCFRIFGENGKFRCRGNSLGPS
jgi:uncharacterized protein with GYD domain